MAGSKSKLRATDGPKVKKGGRTARGGPGKDQAERRPRTGQEILARLMPMLYDDKNYLAVVKPAGIDIGDAPQTSGPGLIEKLKGAVAEGVELHACNRLSRYESGIALLAKSTAAAQHVRTALRLGRVRLEYAAVVRGEMKKPLVVLSSKGEADDHGKGRTRGKRPGQGKAADDSAPFLRVKLLEQGERLALVHCQTNLENTHSLRAKLRAGRLRLLGDNLNDPSPRWKSPRRTCLHLTQLAFRPPDVYEDVVIKAPSPRHFVGAMRGDGMIERALHAAIIRRSECFLDASTDAYRLLTGDAEDVPGLVAERYGPVIVLQVMNEKLVTQDILERATEWYVRSVGVQTVYVKRFVRNRAQVEEEALKELAPPEPFLGPAVAAEVRIQERGITYAIRPFEGFSTGLFLDQRENRVRVRTLARGKRCLNLFAYTCGFSLAAARGGALRTVSVDLANKHLDWGRTNFTLNGLDPMLFEQHEFVRADARDYLERAAKHGEKFDLIVIDPPTFAHGRRAGKEFSIVEHLRELVSAAAKVMAEGGVLMVSTNNRSMTLSMLLDHIRTGAGGRRYEVLSTPRLPVDFAMDPRHAKSAFVQFQ